MKLKFSRKCAKVAIIMCPGCQQLPQTKWTQIWIKKAYLYCYIVFCCIALAQLPIIISPWKKSYVCLSLKILEVLGSWIIIAKQGNTKCRWKAIPSGASEIWSLNFIQRAVKHAWKLITWLAVAVKDTKLLINTTITLRCFLI